MLDPGNSEDHTTEINEAMAALNLLGGGTLKLGIGTFFHDSNIEVPSYVCLIGTSRDGTILKLKDDASQFRVAGNIRLRRTVHTTIRHLTVDSNKENQSIDDYGRFGFYSDLSNYSYIHDVLMKNNIEYGFDPHGDKDTGHSYYLVIDSCESFNNGRDGFTIDQSVFVSITNC